MTPLSRPTRLLGAVAVASLLAIVAAYLLAPAERWTRTVVALLAASGVSIIGVRLVYAVLAGRRYARVLEAAVATQTRSLADSLAATTAAERDPRLVLDALPEAIVVLDPDGRVLEANEPGRKLVGAPDWAPGGRSLFDVVEDDGAAVARERLAAAFAGDVQRFEIPFRRDDGTRGVGAILYAPVRESGRVTRVLALARDITDQKRTESQLQQAERLTAMGQLVSGVAHEINNPAAIVSGFAQTLLLDELKPEQREMVRMIYDEATRIGRITSNLLAFARAGGRERALVDLNDIVRRTFALRAYHLSTLNIAVTLDLARGDPTIWADPSEIQQMLLNLLINAEQALTATAGPRSIAVRTSADEEEARLEVADSGPGIPPEARGKVFDPFFTTKAEGLGTGLGLSICYAIARDHGGRIWVESDPGRGATFIVTLPRDPRGEGHVTAPPASSADAREPATGTLTVLIIDDETALRSALLRFLARRGIEGQGVADGAEALRVLRDRKFDAIVSDVRMPGMSGREFVEELRRDRPELLPRLIFSTGDTFEADTAALLKECGVPSVTKPFAFAHLEQVVRQIARAAGRGPPPATP